MLEQNPAPVAIWGDVALAPNTELCFSVTVPKSADAKIHIIAKDIYNLYINGRFVCFGPARAAEGYCRVDSPDIGAYLTEDENIVCVYVKSIYSGTLSFCKEKPLFGCLIESAGKTVAVSDDFSCYLMTDSIIQTERMSRQRGFCEVYEMAVPREANDFSHYRAVAIKKTEQPRLLPRRVSFSTNERHVFDEIKAGTVSLKTEAETQRLLLEKQDFGAKFDGYARNCCESLSSEFLSFQYDKPQVEPQYAYKIFDGKHTTCGKFEIEVEAENDVTLFVTYDDLLVNGTVDCFREKITHALKWSLKKGKYKLLSGDVYSARYVQIVSDDIEAIKAVSVIAIENSDVLAKHRTGNEKVDAIITAAERTFRQNAYDLLTDCPSRERAAWLCDSYFAAKAERFFTGQNRVETNMLENYLLCNRQAYSHEGIIPMCYPSHITQESENIPGWTLWYILELEDHLKRTGDRDFVQKFSPQLTAVFEWFAAFENEYELLENLPNWNFVEWSRASDYVDDVGIPNNILYAEALRAAGEMLNDNALTEKSRRIRQQIVSRAFNGTVFCDNLLRKDGKLVATENHTELCQIFAAYFGIISENETFMQNFCNDFADTPYAGRLDKTAMFIGEILRLMTYYKLGRYRKVVDCCIEKFSDMARTTGTLWEFFSTQAGCNHGFAAIVGMLLYDSFNKIGKGSNE
ncbi:MAG: hypothetical protein MJ132_05725 [Clostridia bacterium]|nr:hypothetical protein [Clostridia bacterium]